MLPFLRRKASPLVSYFRHLLKPNRAGLVLTWKRQESDKRERLLKPKTMRRSSG